MQTVMAVVGFVLDHPGDASPDAPFGQTFTINNTLTTILVGSVLPVINGLLLRTGNPEWVKTLVSGMVAALATALSQAVQDDGSTFLSQEWFLQLGVTWIVMIATYYGLWKPVVNPNASLPSVQDVTTMSSSSGP